MRLRERDGRNVTLGRARVTIPKLISSEQDRSFDNAFEGRVRREFTRHLGTILLSAELLPLFVSFIAG